MAVADDFVQWLKMREKRPDSDVSDDESSESLASWKEKKFDGIEIETISKQNSKPKVSTKPRAPSSVENSYDDIPLHPDPSDAEVKSTVLEFLESKDLATVTVGMIKEVVRNKYDEAVLRTKKEAIAKGIEEGMEAL